MAVCASCQCARNSSPLNLLPSGVTIISSVFSILGALVVLGQWIQIKLRKRRSGITRDIITMWAVAEFVTASSYIVAGINFIAMSRGEGSHCDAVLESVCKIQCFVTTWFSISCNIWTVILMLHLVILLMWHVKGSAGKFMPVCYTIAFICPLAIVLPLLGTGNLECNKVGVIQYPVIAFVLAGPIWVICTFIIIVGLSIGIEVWMARSYARRHLVSLSSFAVYKLGAKKFSQKILGDLVMACHIPCTSRKT